jgi:hypothetical protein
MTTVDLRTYLDAAKGHRPGTFPRRKRIVIRMDPQDVTRLDVLRGRHQVSRATIARALVFVGLLAVEPSSGAPPAPEGGAP